MVAEAFEWLFQRPALLFAIGLLGAFILLASPVMFGPWPSEKERREYMLVITVFMVAGMGFVVGLVFFGG